MAEPCTVERELIALLYRKLTSLSELADLTTQQSAELADEYETADLYSIALSFAGMRERIDEAQDAIRQHGFASTG